MLFLIFFIVLTKSQIQLVLLTSPFTTQVLQAQLSSDLLGVVDRVQSNLNLNVPIELTWAFIDLLTESDQSLWRLPFSVSQTSVQVILDASNSVYYSMFLSSVSAKSSLLHVVMSRPMDTLNNEKPCPNTLFAETSYLSQATAIYDFISQYSWVNIGLIEDYELNNSQLSLALQDLLTSPMQVLDQLIIDPDDLEELEGIQYRLQSTMKDSQARVIVVMCEASIASQVLSGGRPECDGRGGLHLDSQQRGHDPHWRNPQELKRGHTARHLRGAQDWGRGHNGRGRPVPVRGAHGHLHCNVSHSSARAT